MSELIAANWWLLVIALALGLIVAWWIFVLNRKARVEIDRRDTLDEGGAKAQRNQALIDAPVKASDIIAAPPSPAKAPEPVAAKPAPAKKPKPVAKTPATKTAKAPAKKPAPAARKPAPPPVRELDQVPPPTPDGLAGIGTFVQAEVARAPAPHDDLALIKGLGPKLVLMLHQLGVTGFDDIAGWGEADIDRIDAQLEQFAGRIRRDNWVEQARLLGAGDIAGFETKFGKL